jgi:DNA adenine methylase
MLIRYPGSKDKHLVLLLPYLKRAENTRTVYEPFAGTAAVTFYLLENRMVDYYLINDIDEGMFALWKTVKSNPEKLIKAVKNYVPSVSDFYYFKENSGTTMFEKAFRKLVLHQISYSGLGAMAGGPMGGKNQTSQYAVDCRWYPNKLEEGIRKCSTLLNSVQGDITFGGWEDTVNKAITNEGFLYLDPPYFIKGNELYVNGGLNHQKLSEKLKQSNDFVLSYDDTLEIRKMYSWAKINKIDVRSHLHHKMITDVAITPN